MLGGRPPGPRVWTFLPPDAETDADELRTLCQVVYGSATADPWPEDHLRRLCRRVAPAV